MRRTWDGHIDPEFRDDPHEAFSAWERWMEARDDSDMAIRSDDAVPLMERVPDIVDRIELYSRFVDAAAGDGIPWRVRLWDVATEPIVRARWRLRSFAHEVRWSTRWYVRHWRAGGRPRRGPHGGYVADYVDAEGRPHYSSRGMWWDRLPISPAWWGRRAAIRRMEAKAR